jgi:hypothetical protein
LHSLFGAFSLAVGIAFSSTSSVTRRDSRHTLYLKMFFACSRVVVALPELMDISHLVHMLFPESSTIPWLVQNSEINLGRMLTESPKEFAELPGFQTPLVLEELRFSFEGISSSWNTGLSGYISLEGSPFEAVSTLSVLQKHLRGCLYQEGYIAVCCLGDTAALAFSQAPPVPYFLCWKPLLGCRGWDTAALAMCQAPPVIHCSLGVSTCPPAPGHLRDRSNSEKNLGRMLTESPKKFAEFPGFHTPLVSEQLRFSLEGISSSWNTGFSGYILLEGSPFEAVSTLSVLQKHLRDCLYQEGYIAVCCLGDTAALAFSQAPPVPYLC